MDQRGQEQAVLKDTDSDALVFQISYLCLTVVSYSPTLFSPMYVLFQFSPFDSTLGSSALTTVLIPTRPFLNNLRLIVTHDLATYLCRYARLVRLISRTRLKGRMKRSTTMT
jgi:hypothetical protein